MQYSSIPTALVVTAGLLIAASAQAGVVIQVNDCSDCTLAQIEALMPRCDRGFRYITDFSAGGLYKGCYELQGEQHAAAIRNVPPPASARSYHWMKPAAAYQNAFKVYLDVYTNNGHVKLAKAKIYVHTDLKPILALGDDGYMNAYDTISASANNHAVTSWLESADFTASNVKGVPIFGTTSPALDGALLHLLNIIKTSPLSFDFVVSTDVVFHDKSKRDYTIDKYNDWNAIPGTARDGHDNRIPEKSNSIVPDHGTDTYDYSSAGPDYDMNNFLRLLRDYRIPVDNKESGGKQYVCAWNGHSHNIKCTQGAR